MKRISFGTDGWRAVIADSFTVENIIKVSQAYASYLLESNQNIKNGIAIGYDTRFMSNHFASLIGDVLSHYEIAVFLSASFLPTPILSFTVKNKNLAGGIMVTASHNPYFYNGLKFKGPYGGPLISEATAEIEKLIKNRTQPYSPNKKLIIKEDFFPAYFKHIKKWLKWKKIKSFESHIVFDTMHGAGCEYFDRILKKTSVNSVYMRNNPDPMFSGTNPEPIASHLKSLKNKIKKVKAICGIATDGDADRFGILDENGAFVELHDLMPLLYEHLICTRKWKGKIVRTTSMADTIDKIATKYNSDVLEVAVGFKNVTEAMLENEVIIGGEESGGFGYKNHIPERDGILSALLFIELLAESNKKPSQLIKQLRKKYGPFVYKRIDQYGDSTSLQRNISKLQSEDFENLGQYKIESINRIDGIKVYFENGAWMLIRLSQTEPLFRIYVAGKTKKDVKRILNLGINLMTS